MRVIAALCLLPLAWASSANVNVPQPVISCVNSCAAPVTVNCAVTCLQNNGAVATPPTASQNTALNSFQSCYNTCGGNSGCESNCASSLEAAIAPTTTTTPTNGTTTTNGTTNTTLPNTTNTTNTTNSSAAARGVYAGATVLLASLIGSMMA